LLLDVLTVREGGGGGEVRKERTEKKNTLDEPLSAKCEVKTGASSTRIIKERKV
jgi:hypothetical protein